LKKLFLVLLAAAALSSSIFLSPSAPAGEDAKGAHVIAYYFHGTMRCPTCHKLEQYSKEAIETNFKDALVSGKLEFKVINVEDKGNEHYGNDYQLYTKSLIVSELKDGKEVRWKNLEKIWELVRDEEEFDKYVQDEINDWLKE